MKIGFEIMDVYLPEGLDMCGKHYIQYRIRFEADDQHIRILEFPLANKEYEELKRQERVFSKDGELELKIITKVAFVLKTGDKRK